jgi:STAS domain
MRSSDLLDNGHGNRIAFGFHDGVTVIGLVGAHDLSNSERLRAAIDHECAHDRGVVVSFTAADFIDSSVLFELLKADQRLQAHGRRLVLHTNPMMTCDRILGLVTTRDALPRRQRLDHAIALASLRNDDREEAEVSGRPREGT